jgi:hypothetical protein
MLRAKLIIIVSIVLLATAVHAGEIKLHEWPKQFVPIEISTFPVVMDIGYWMAILNQNQTIKLQQIDIHTYKGCIDLIVRTNFNLLLSAKILPTGVIPGTYSCIIENPAITPPSGTATLCAMLQNANIIGKPGGAKNVHVASITVRVVPN